MAIHVIRSMASGDRGGLDSGGSAMVGSNESTKVLCPHLHGT
ncbi:MULTISPECIES: hypothetical protein [Anaeromyxobacter]|nr:MULTISPECIES: hypothetical protein [unclassified Anaeromyxobacter]